MANEQNLKPFTSEQSREAAVKNGAKGGIAAGKARRERKAMKDTLETLLSMSLEEGTIDDLEEIQSVAAICGKNITVQEAIMFAQIQKAIKGDTKAAEYIRDTSGNKLKEGIELSGEVGNPFANLSTEELRKLANNG